MEVSLVTVGDELLSGHTANTNATWLARRLDERGARLRRISVVPDEIPAIVEVLLRHRASYDAVIITGGLGPTHDDVTIEAVAEAFDRPLEENQEVLRWLREEGGYTTEELTVGTAALPAGARPLHNDEGVAPGAKVENVYVLPGVPTEMKAMFEQLREEFTGATRVRESIVVDEPESALVERLDEVQERFDVTIGSYPGDDVVIRVIGTDESEVEEASDWLRDRVDRALPEEEP